VDFSVGGGVTAESGPALEHQETLDKAAAAMAALRRGAKLRAS
jgi:anthranilate/para-aminobenzoate synthase component I